MLTWAHWNDWSNAYLRQAAFACALQSQANDDAGRGSEIYEAENLMGKMAERACRNLEPFSDGAVH